MNPLLTDHPFALGLLLTEDLYFLAADQTTEQDSSPMLLQATTSPPAQQPEVLPERAQAKVREPASFDYLGENNTFFLLIVEDKEYKVAAPAHQESLKKILAGAKIGMKDIALINLFHYPDVTFNDLRDFFACSKAVLFGIDPQRLGLPRLPSNEPAKPDGVKLLATFSFTEMNADDHKKRLFWNAFKTF